MPSLDMFRAALFALLAVLAPAARAQPASVGCTGVFAADSSHANLVEAFGKANVIYKRIDRPQGSTGFATILFEQDPERRLLVEWRDKASRSRPIYIGISGRSRWVAPLGIRLGTPLAEVEQLNGKPFRLNGFGWDLGGNAAFDKLDGKLGELPGGCQFGFAFEPTAEGLPLGGRYRALNGNLDLRSDLPLLREVKPAVVEILLIFPQNH
jgi:hypothetical protein